MTDPSAALLVNEQRSTRDQILDEALVCFAHAGYDGTSAERHRRRSRDPATEPYCTHFHSKEALYGEVFERALSDWFARLHDAIDLAGDRVGEGRAGARRRIPVLRRERTISCG
jgi:AcrR family transcriptional regulator